MAIGLLSALHDVWVRAADLPEERICRRLTCDARFGGDFARLYFHHLRKTGGTSVVFSLLAGDREDAADVYRRLRTRRIHRTISEGRVFVGWRRSLIEAGHYHFAFSHLPAHAVSLPPRTFAFTCLRDPVARVLSHYRMLVEYAESGRVPRAVARSEIGWLGDGFDDFLERLPRAHLQAQLHAFSPRFDVEEAHDRLRALPLVLRTEDLDAGLAALSRRVGLRLAPRHERRSAARPEIPAASLERLRDRLAPEIDLCARFAAG